MNLHVPAEAIPAKRRSRWLDWRFLAALAALALVAFLIYAGFRNYQARDAEAAQKSALIAELSERAKQIEDLERDIAALSERAREDRREASRERAQLLHQQRRMIRLLQRFGVAPPTGAATADGTRQGATTDANDEPTRPAGTEPGDEPDPTPKPDPDPKPKPPPEEEPGPLDWLPLPDLPDLLVP